MSTSADRIVVGAIAGAFGVKGEIRLKSFCATPESIANYKPLFSEDGREFKLKLGRQVKGGFAARIEGVRYKDQADALRGVKLLGIDSVYQPKARRETAWQRLATDLDPAILEKNTSEVTLAEIPNHAAAILKGQIRGRVVVDVRR